MNVFVIGGTGFIGRHVTKRLAAGGHRVTVLHRGDTSPWLPASVTSVHASRDDASALRDAAAAAFGADSVDVVLDVIPYTEAHARALVKAADHAGAARVVVLSSGDVYRQYDGLWGRSDVSPEPGPLTEESPLRSQHYPYRGSGVDFTYADDYDKILVESVVRTAGVPATILRLPKVWGQGDGQQTVQGMAAALRDDDEVHILGDAEAQWRWSHGYVENVAAAIACATTDDRAAGRTYNVGEPGALPRITWMRRIADVIGWDGECVTRPDAEVEQMPLDWRYPYDTDTRRIRTELDFAEPVSHADALARTLNGGA